MGTKSDAKTIGWGSTSEQRMGRIIMGQFSRGNSLGVGTRGKSKGEWYGEKAKEARIMGRIFMGAT